MFCNDLREKYEEKIILKGVDAETMNILLDYTYTSKMLITKQNVQKVLEAASLFQVQIAQMHRSSLVALATVCSGYSTAYLFISWVPGTLGFVCIYTAVKIGHGTHGLECFCTGCCTDRQTAGLCLPELLPGCGPWAACDRCSPPALPHQCLPSGTVTSPLPPPCLEMEAHCTACTFLHRSPDGKVLVTTEAVRVSSVTQPLVRKVFMCPVSHL